jgi:hypothetical protein
VEARCVVPTFISLTRTLELQSEPVHQKLLPQDKAKSKIGGPSLADMIPEFLPDGTSQGERCVFAALQSLPDDVTVYYGPVIRRRFPDFIVIAPSIGVIVIEVKGIPPQDHHPIL